MKKIVIISMFFLLVGLILGTKIYSARTSLSTTFGEGTTYYFLQEGVYTSKEIMEENIKSLNQKAIEYDDDKYYVYVGITKEASLAKKIKELYEKANYQIYIKEVRLSNEEFDSNVTQFDLLMNSATTKEELLTIMEVVLANYEEIIIKQ